MAFAFLKSLFLKLAQKVIHDDYLGTMTKDRFGVWSGSKYFGPTEAVITFSVRSGQLPLSSQQVAFVREVESQFSTIWNDLWTYYFADNDEHGDAITDQQIFDSLKVDSIRFRNFKVEPYRWEICCKTPLHEHVFCFEMIGFDNAGLLMV